MSSLDRNQKESMDAGGGISGRLGLNPRPLAGTDSLAYSRPAPWAARPPRLLPPAQRYL